MWNWVCFDEPGILCQTDDKHMLSSWSTVLTTSKGQNNLVFHLIPGQIWGRSNVLLYPGWKSLPQTSECASVCGRQCWSAASEVSLSASACIIRISSVKQKRHTKQKTPLSHFLVLWDYTIRHKIHGHDFCSFVVVILRLLQFIFKPSI